MRDYVLVERYQQDIRICKENGIPMIVMHLTGKTECPGYHEIGLKRLQEIADYANLSIGDIVSGYISQVHNSRDLEIDMVKQIQQKSEVQLSCLLHSHPYHASPQVYYL